MFFLLVVTTCFTSNIFLLAACFLWLSLLALAGGALLAWLGSVGCWLHSCFASWRRFILTASSYDHTILSNSS